MKEFLQFLLPTHIEQGILAVGAWLGAVVSFLYGGDAETVLGWLLIFIVTDYATGTAAAVKNGEWSSKFGFWGIAKKVFILALVSLCHGTDVLNPLQETVSLRDVCAFAFALNELGSVVENIDRLGYGSLIPKPLRGAMAQLRAENGKKYGKDKEADK